MSLFKNKKVKIIWLVPVAALIYLGTFLCTLFVVLLLHAYVIKPYSIPSESMRNTLQIGDSVFVNRLYSKPKHGDIIVFEFPGKQSLIPWDKVVNQTSLELWENKSHIAFVERCIAIEGDTIDIRENKVYLNGKMLPEPYILEPMVPNPMILPNITFPYTVPPGYVFVLGDNRNNSWDSRFWGPVNVKLLKGKAFIMFWYSRDREGKKMPFWKPWTWWRMQFLK